MGTLVLSPLAITFHNLYVHEFVWFVLAHCGYVWLRLMPTFPIHRVAQRAALLTFSTELTRLTNRNAGMSLAIKHRSVPLLSVCSFLHSNPIWWSVGWSICTGTPVFTFGVFIRQEGTYPIQVPTEAFLREAFLCGFVLVGLAVFNIWSHI